MKTYVTKNYEAWDAISKATLGSEMLMHELMAVQPQELLKYMLVPPNTNINVPEEIIEDNDIFRAPWSEDET